VVTANRKTARSERRGLAADIAEFIRLLRSLTDTYRPELHYMRGPGPKWRAKHAVNRGDAPLLPGLARSER
jgi:hypothetical protein